MSQGCRAPRTLQQRPPLWRYTLRAGWPPSTASLPRRWDVAPIICMLFSHCFARPRCDTVMMSLSAHRWHSSPTSRGSGSPSCTCGRWPSGPAPTQQARRAPRWGGYIRLCEQAGHCGTVHEKQIPTLVSPLKIHPRHICRRWRASTGPSRAVTAACASAASSAGKFPDLCLSCHSSV